MEMEQDLYHVEEFQKLPEWKKSDFPDWSSNAERDSDGAAMSLAIMLHIEPAKVFCEVGVIHCGLLT